MILKAISLLKVLTSNKEKGYIPKYRAFMANKHELKQKLVMNLHPRFYILRGFKLKNDHFVQDFCQNVH